MLVGNNFPELGADLVAALSSLNVHDLSHVLVFSRLVRICVDFYNRQFKLGRVLQVLIDTENVKLRETVTDA